MNLQSTTWRNFTAAPHRVMFLSGVVQGIATLLWWLIDLSGRYGMGPQWGTWTIPSIWAHSYLMIYGFFPFFIFGFLFTTYPNWMNGEKVSARYYVPAFLLMAGGVVLFYAGMIAGLSILAAGVMLMMAGWGIALYALLRIFINASHPDKRHPLVTTIALAMGWLGMGGMLLWLVADYQWALNFARIGGVWFFLLPVFMTVSHRMIPFFSSKVIENYVVVRPYWVLWLMLACAAGHGTMQWAGVYAYQWLFDLPLAITALALSYLWGIHRSFKNRLLAMLHVAFFWLGIATALYAAQSIALFLSGGELFMFGLAPLHALTIGFFASMMLGMVSRVTLGHSGHPLVADSVTWLFFWGFQLVALLRVLPDLLMAGNSHVFYAYLLAAVVWLVSFVPWAIKYAPGYWRPRVDGKPG